MIEIIIKNHIFVLSRKIFMTRWARIENRIGVIFHWMNYTKPELHHTKYYRYKYGVAQNNN
jgi:hypothetical protein